MTIDMTNNRVPYGLLFQWEKDELDAHRKKGGRFQSRRIQADSWMEIGSPHWHPDLVFRILPIPEDQDVIAWERLPEWVMWVARDYSGVVWAFEQEPYKDSSSWYSKHEDQLQIDDFPGLVQIGTCDWRDSKQRRPRG
jgi:hypothetical protein